MTRKPPSYRLHKGSGQAFVQHHGRRHYLGKYGSPASKERYQRFIAEAWAKPSPLVQAKPGGGLLIVQLAAAYWEFAEAYYQKDGEPTGQIHMVRSALKILRQLYDTLPAHQFGPLALRAIQAHLTEAKKSRSTINHLVATIKGIFKWAVSEELLPAAIYQALVTVSGLKAGRTEAREPEPIGPVPDHVVDATLPHLPVVVADMIQFQRRTGCRPGEVCSIRPVDVDRTGEVWEYRPASHKTAHLGRKRIIYIGPKAQDVLRPYLLRPAEAFCFSPADSEVERHEEQRERRKTRVQPSQADRRKKRPKRKPKDHYVKDAYNRAVHRAVDLANRRALEEALARGEDAPHPIPHWHPNQLRHSAATEIRKLFGLEAAQVALGHSRADVTQVYAERDMKLAAEIARKIG